MLISVILSAVIASNYLGTSGRHLNATGLAGETSSLIEIQNTAYNRLNVPYASQGETNWCFETSLSMVLQYYGKPVMPADIANSLGERGSDSISFLDMFFGPVDVYLSAFSDISVRRQLGNWDFSQYVEIIDKGMPVIASTFGFPGHTVVVVGYSEADGNQDLYVHDPSGFYSIARWGDDKVTNARVSWSSFSKSRWMHFVVRPVSPGS